MSSKRPWDSPPKRKFGIQCLKCNDRIFSWSGHDFKYCKCGACFIDGGNEYMRYGYERADEIKRVYHTPKDGPRVDIERRKAGLERKERWPY